MNDEKALKLKTSLPFVNDLGKRSNQFHIDVFLHLQIIFITGSWQNDSFYEGYSELKPYKNKKFTALISDIYNRSMTWFKNMEHILDLPSGRELYIRHGHANMVTYLRLSPDHREIVMKVAKNNPQSSFHYILKSQGLKGKRPEVIKDETMKELQKSLDKYKNLKEKYNVLKHDYDQVMQDNLRLKKKLNKLIANECKV